MKLGVVLFAASLVACHPSSHISIVQPDADASPPPETSTACENACAHIASVAPDCPEGQNAKCAEACERDQAQGTGAQLDVACVQGVANKAALGACGVRCVP